MKPIWAVFLLSVLATTASAQEGAVAREGVTLVLEALGRGTVEETAAAGLVRVGGRAAIEDLGAALTRDGGETAVRDLAKLVERDGPEAIVALRSVRAIVCVRQLTP